MWLCAGRLSEYMRAGSPKSATTPGIKRREDRLWLLGCVCACARASQKMKNIFDALIIATRNANKSTILSEGAHTYKHRTESFGSNSLTVWKSLSLERMTIYPASWLNWTGMAHTIPIPAHRSVQACVYGHIYSANFWLHNFESKTSFSAIECVVDCI